MTILAIDPGITTGVSVIKDDGTLIHAADLSPGQLDQLIAVSFLAETIVIEDIPVHTSGPLATQLSAVNRRLRTMFPDALTIKPGLWKPVMVNHPTPDVLSSPHQRDAYLIAEYVRKGHHG